MTKARSVCCRSNLCAYLIAIAWSPLRCSSIDALVSSRMPARMGKSRSDPKASILAGAWPLSSRLSSSSFRSFTGSPWASAAWKVRSTSSTETLKP